MRECGGCLGYGTAWSWVSEPCCRRLLVYVTSAWYFWGVGCIARMVILSFCPFCLSFLPSFLPSFLSSFILSRGMGKSIPARSCPPLCWGSSLREPLGTGPALLSQSRASIQQIRKPLWLQTRTRHRQLKNPQLNASTLARLGNSRAPNLPWTRRKELPAMAPLRSPWQRGFSLFSNVTRCFFHVAAMVFLGGFFWLRCLRFGVLGLPRG